MHKDHATISARKTGLSKEARIEAVAEPTGNTRFLVWVPWNFRVQTVALLYYPCPRPALCPVSQRLPGRNCDLSCRPTVPQLPYYNSTHESSLDYSSFITD